MKSESDGVMMTVDMKGQTFAQVYGFFQWDCGQVLELTGLPFSGSFEAHVAYEKLGVALVEYCTVQDGTAAVPLPDAVLQQPVDHFDVWIYETSTASGKTVVTVRCFVTPRSRPADVEEITQIDISKLRAIPTATAETVGGITAEPKTDAQTMPVGIDPKTGRLYTESGGAGYPLGDGLKVVDGKLTVDTADTVQQDNTRPVTSAAVYTEVGNIEVLLANI